MALQRKVVFISDQRIRFARCVHYLDVRLEPSLNGSYWLQAEITFTYLKRPFWPRTSRSWQSS